MAALNALPRTQVSGENGNIFTELQALDRKLQGQASHEDVYAWHNSFLPSQIICDLRNFVVDVINPTEKNTTIGFKEIRVNQREQIDFVLRLFPCAKIILNYRKDVSKQARSAFYSKRYPNKKKQKKIAGWLRDKNKLFENYANENPDRVFVLPLESLSAGVLNTLLTFLGYSNCTFTDVPKMNLDGSYKKDFSEEDTPEWIHCS